MQNIYARLRSARALLPRPFMVRELLAALL
jgi:hypothetical protein